MNLQPVANRFFIPLAQFNKVHAAIFVTVLAVETLNLHLFNFGWKREMGVELLKLAPIQMISILPFQSIYLNVASVAFNIFFHLLRPSGIWLIKTFKLESQSISGGVYRIFNTVFWLGKARHINYRLVTIPVELRNVTTKIFCSIAAGRVLQQMVPHIQYVQPMTTASLLTLSAYNIYCQKYH
jgi:hypothetical protein